MIDLKLLKENPQVIKDMLKKRNLDFPIDELIAIDKRRRELIFETQEIKHKKNNLANSISIKKKNNDDTNAELEEMRAIGRKIVSIDQEKMTIELRFRRLIMMLPNIIDKSVPIGNDETNNLIIKPEGGSKKKISFKPKDHVDIATNLDLIDLERAKDIRCKVLLSQKRTGNDEPSADTLCIGFFIRERIHTCSTSLHD